MQNSRIGHDIECQPVDDTEERLENLFNKIVERAVKTSRTRPCHQVCASSRAAHSGPWASGTSLNQRLIGTRRRFGCLLGLLQRTPNIAWHLRRFEQPIRFLSISDTQNLAETSPDSLRRSVVVPVTQINRVDPVRQNL